MLQCNSMNYKEAIEYINKSQKFSIQLGLNRIGVLLEYMGNPHKKLKFVHIAGTNGKGSTASLVASVLKKAGYKTGLFTSPYISKFNERIQVNGVNIPDKYLIKAVEQLKEVIENMDEKPTEFELITAIGFLYFYECHCDIVVLEVGLGGRLDSTNVIEYPEAAVITAIGLDHINELGDTVEKIAREKAGIIKEGCDVILYQQQDSVHDVFESVCREKSARLHNVNFDNIEVISSDLKGQSFNYKEVRNIEISLLGEHQLKNAAVALKTIEVLREKGWRISEEDIRNGFKETKWPGRFEVLMEKPYFIVDGAHNPHGVQALINNINKYFYGRKLIFLVGILRDKDYSKMLDLIEVYGKKIIAVQPNNPRALKYNELGSYLKNRYDIEVIEVKNIKHGVDISLKLADSSDVIIAFGSLYMLGDIRDFFYK